MDLLSTQNKMEEKRTWTANHGLKKEKRKGKGQFKERKEKKGRERKEKK